MLKSASVPAAMAIAMTAAFLASGCALSCSASPQKLSALRRGMTYAETSQVMGCPGTAVTAGNPATNGYAIVEWNGPESLVFRRTRIDFQDGKLLSYTTEPRGAL